jgi:hypothetical protein
MSLGYICLVIFNDVIVIYYIIIFEISLYYYVYRKEANYQSPVLLPEARRGERAAEEVGR